MPAASIPTARLRLTLYSAALALGLLRTLAARGIGGGDNLSYLDIATFYARGDFARAVNAFWSPLYSWILALALRLGPGTPEWDFATQTLATATLYLLALVSFFYFWRSFAEWRAARSATPGLTSLPEVAWLLLGFDLFLWSSLELNRLGIENPDLLLSCFVFLAAGLLLRICAGQARTYAALGVVLGLGYLAKTAMFPLALVLLGVAAVASPAPRTWRRTLLAVLCFLAVALPWVAIISTHTGKLTLGESGRLNYSFHVNRVPFTHWQGRPDTGAPQHVSRRIYEHPDVYEFADAPGITYPVWFDPARWNRGLAPRFDLGDQLRALGFNAWLYLLLFASRLDLMMVWLMLLAIGARRGLARRLRELWFLWLPALAALSMYGIVHVERRYVAAFLVLFWTAAFSALRFPVESPLRRLQVMGVVALLVASGLQFLARMPEDLRRIRQRPEGVYLQAAAELQRLGARPGDRIAIFGDALWNSSAARLARVQVAVEMPTDQLDAYGSASPEERTQIRERLAAAGVGYVIAECGDDCSLSCTRFPNTSTRSIQGPRTLAVCRLSDLP
ncbi:MAG TPA: hypothetical protein VLE48_04685 [Terriglobales bacterium]|nr:hypothetical protein [Terriglobales bacterium]